MKNDKTETLLPSNPAVEAFWDWFKAHNEQLTMLNDLDDSVREALLQELQAQLETYCPGLSFDMGDATPNGRRLVFTAEGDTDYFEQVLALTDNAPILDWWDFVAFKQPCAGNLCIRFDRYTFHTDAMQFLPLECAEEPEVMGLRIAVDAAKVGLRKGVDPNEDEDFMIGIYTTIESIVGEFDCATVLGYFEVVPMPAEPFKEGFKPMADLVQYLEWFKRQHED